MTIWLAIAGITVIVVVALLMPLFGRGGQAVPRKERDLAIYKDQMAELERELAAGRISPTEAKAAEAEIQRKILASAVATDSAENAASLAAVTQIRLAAAVAVASLAPIGALLVYLSVGSPGIPAYPFNPQENSQQAVAGHGDAETQAMIARLAERMKQDPNNLEGWVLLARSYGAVERHADAAQAYERAYDLSGQDVAYAGDYGEALVLAASGEVVPAARALFEQVAAHDPGEPRARYYLALALAQSGKPRDAIAMWRGLEADSPSDAPWLPAVREVIQTVAKEAGIDASTVPPLARAPSVQKPGPTAEDVAAAQAMSPDDQRQMIKDMVARLAQRLQSNPNDLEGWKRLGRSYLVLNEPIRAQEAYAHAVALAPTDLAVLAGYADATMLAPGTVAVPKESIEALRKLLASDGADATALWLVAVAESEAGNAPQATVLLQRLLQQLQPDTAAYKTVRARLDRLTPAP